LGGCGTAGGAGLYTTAGLAGAPFCLISFFFGFFFSRPRVSRLPMSCSPRTEIWPPRPTATPSTSECLMTWDFSFSQFRIAAQVLRDSAPHDLRRSCSVSSRRARRRANHHRGRRRSEVLSALLRQADQHEQRILFRSYGNPTFQLRIAFAGWLRSYPTNKGRLPCENFSYWCRLP
jgi:hypothetical protein